jgi:hypothetical protein
MLDLCETVELAVGDGDTDSTFDNALAIAHQRDPGLRLHVRPWDMSNTGDGSELARQVNVVLPFVQGKWILYLQADEFIHQEDHARLRQLLTNLDETHPEVTQVELWRTYFWGLNYRVPKHDLSMSCIWVVFSKKEPTW